jgi:four helix bundle protein
MAITHYREMVVWQRSIELVIACYACTRSFPTDERFGLTQQAQRAAVSIPSNIAEGQGRWHRGELLHHIAIARGSLQELETLLEIAERLGYGMPEALRVVRSLADEVSRMLSGLRRALT